MPPRHLVLPLRDAARNLATEEILLRTLPPGHPGLFLLWRNEPAVILGLHQCAEDEVALAQAAAESVPVVRRMTGGGAVCHDAGTLCFSWIRHDDDLGPAFRHSLAPVVAALADVGVTAHLSGRNDLEAGGRKVSGSAQVRVGGRLLCHGTLLVTADLGRMGRLLTPGSAKRRAHGVASVRSRVGNLTDLWTGGTTMADLTAALLRRCAPDAASPDAAPDPLADAMAELLAERKYRSPHWNFGAVTGCTRVHARRFPWGGVELRLTLHGGRIARARVTGDFFSDLGMEGLERRLEGVRAEAGAVRTAVAGLPWERLFAGCEAAAMTDFFASAAGA